LYSAVGIFIFIYFLLLLLFYDQVSVSQSAGFIEMFVTVLSI